MLLKEGDLILVAHRRLFERDDSRFFIGKVDAYDMGIVKATGHSYVRERMSGNVLEKADVRTKLLSISSGTLMVYQLPNETCLESLAFSFEHGCLSLTDGKELRMNLMEAPQLGRV